MVFGRIKIISDHKPWVILFITYFNDSLLLFYIFVMSFNMQKILMLFQQYCAKSIMTSLVWDIKNLFTGYGGKYVINIYIYMYTHIWFTPGLLCLLLKVITIFIFIDKMLIQILFDHLTKWSRKNQLLHKQILIWIFS